MRVEAVALDTLQASKENIVNAECHQTWEAASASCWRHSPACHRTGAIDVHSCRTPFPASLRPFVVSLFSCLDACRRVCVQLFCLCSCQIVGLHISCSALGLCWSITAARLCGAQENGRRWNDEPHEVWVRSQRIRGREAPFQYCYQTLQYTSLIGLLQKIARFAALKG